MQSNEGYLFGHLSINDVFLVPSYIVILLIIVVIIRNNNIKNHPEYKFLVKGIIFKFLVFYYSVLFICFTMEVVIH